VFAGGDCYGTQYENNFRSWFHFSIEAHKGFELSLSIRAISITPRLFREGMKPVFRNQGSEKWKRVKGEFNYRIGNDGMVDISFLHLFNHEKVYFAFTYPWSY
jgi:hypothetical protein